MKTQETPPVAFASHCILVLLLCAHCVLCGESSAQDFKQLHPGVEHAQEDHKLGPDPVKINLLRLDLKKVRLDVHHALDKAIGLETTSSIATRKGAVAAINAGFFRLDKSAWAGDAAGVFMMDGKLLSDSVNGRISIGIVNHKRQTDVVFERLHTGALVGFGTDSEFAFDGVNRERRPNEIILYTPDFGANTLTDANGVEIVLSKCRQEEITQWCSVAKANVEHGNSQIPKDGLVIAIGKDALDKANSVLYFADRNGTFGGIHDEFRIVRKIEPSNAKNAEFFKNTEDVTNGVPQLIKNGKIDITWEQEKASKSFAETRHPRTAVAKLKDDKFLMMTVDGRQPGVSVGMSLQELAEYLFSLGAVDAMNLDGGGSTTMFLDGKVVNTPSDKEGERKIGDAIVVTLRKKK